MRFLTFNDVGLIPKFNRITSRMNTNIHTHLGNDLFKSPFIPANMDSVIGTDMAKVCRTRGSPIIFHRFTSIKQQIEWTKEFPEAYLSVGVKERCDNIDTLYYAGCRRFCIDIAHGHSQIVLDTIKRIKDKDGTQVIAGNVCTYEGVMDLATAGADIVKVGIGPGSACITRMMTGMGIPQFTAIQNCNKAKLRLKDKKNVYLIADGGIKYPRDAVLAFAAGADAVMMGSVFARTFESAIPKRKSGFKLFGRYRGQASNEFMKDFNIHRQAEGVAFDVSIHKSSMDVFDEYEGGLRSALTYCGTDNMDDFRKNVEIFESTGNFMEESNYRSVNKL